MAQKVVMRVWTMTDDKTKQKAIEAAADILGQIDFEKLGILSGVDSIAADVREQKLTVVGEMDVAAVVKKLKKVVGKVDIVLVGPAKEEKKKDDSKEDKKEVQKPAGDSKKEDKPEDKKPAAAGDGKK
ncbi:heavy metal-associated isoprenylated plant protein 39 isoform X2 [Andrographis paniculata]|uniref:heavy metal-associated isoprenylated plant protein 39 isoform X2 n=1 Tax=Andrographis paniculata TaxID=175694 RepID=UPI0021E8958F|nr:heavy metal-associated isoprenylated plant protein 39 isoform X2 [Andrographis paniculata]